MSEKTTYPHRKISSTAGLLAIMMVVAAGCQIQNLQDIRPTEIIMPTATPTRMFIAPGPTPSPLFRAERISGAYNQSLILYVGDTFILDNLEGSLVPVSFDSTIVEMISDPARGLSEPKAFRAVKPGTTAIKTLIDAPPCPNAPAGCQPPEYETLVVIYVRDPNQ